MEDKMEDKTTENFENKLYSLQGIHCPFQNSFFGKFQGSEKFKLFPNILGANNLCIRPHQTSVATIPFASAESINISRLLIYLVQT